MPRAWPPVCIHELEVDTCAVCLDAETFDICKCYADYAINGMERPPYDSQGFCSNCRLPGPPIGHTGQHGATCGRCLAYETNQRYKAKAVLGWKKEVRP